MTIPDVSGLARCISTEVAINLLAQQKARDFDMINFIPMGEQGEHLVPEGEQDDHYAYDFCPCQPVQRWINGRYFWMHKVSEERDLWEQAEAIRQVVSITLWRQAQTSGKPYQIIKFPSDFMGAVMPPAAKR